MSMKGHSIKADPPAKPFPSYPLYAHRSGQWAKKIRGPARYFGPWSDPQGALQKRGLGSERT